MFLLRVLPNVKMRIYLKKFMKCRKIQKMHAVKFRIKSSSVLIASAFYPAKTLASGLQCCIVHSILYIYAVHSASIIPISKAPFLAANLMLGVAK
jgi:hypothetical protein